MQTIHWLNPWHPFQGRRECSTSTVTRHPKERTRHQETGTNSSQRTRDKSTISTRGKWKIAIRDWGEERALTERVATPWDKLLCYGISILGAIQELLGKGPSNLSWRLCCIYHEESSAVTGLDQPTSPPSLIYSIIWSHFPPHVQDSTVWEQRREASTEAVHQRLSKAEAASAEHTKFFFLFNACSILYPLKKDGIH